MHMVTIIATWSLLIGGLALASALELQTNLTIADFQRAKQLRPLGVEFFEHYGNLSLPDLLPDARFPSQQDLRCLAELSQMIQALRTGSLWALKMVDAWGSVPAGILSGNLLDMGNFDECLNIKAALGGNLQLKGKYCLANLPIGQLLGLNSDTLRSVSIRTAVCFPASCSGAHMDKLLQQLLQQLLGINYNGQLVSDSSCKTSEREPFDGLTIFTIILLSVLGVSMGLATLCDYFLYQDQTQLPSIVRAFSARANSRTLFRIVESKSNPNVINCLHGIRCLSLIWVVFGHDFQIATSLPNINSFEILKSVSKPFTMFIIQAIYAVDTFFFLSGLLVCMVALRAMERANGKLNVPLMYLHRILRITPVLAVAIIAYKKLLPHMSDGPLWDTSFVCPKDWYYTLLFVQNYASNHICIGHTWYLAVDMQLYVIAPILLYALYRWGKKGVAAIVLFLLLLSACLFSMMMIKKYSLNLVSTTAPINSFKKIYISTHTRAAPWLIGLLFGYFLHINRGKSFQLSRIVVWVGWLLSLACFFTSLFALYPTYQWGAPVLPILDEAFFVTLTRIAWPLGLCWLVFACMQGYGGLANSFLSSPLWQPLSKLSYGVYVWHVFMQDINWLNVKTNTYFSSYEVMLRFWYDFGFTLLLAYFMYILVEAPFTGLGTMLLPNRRPNPKTAVSCEPQLSVKESAHPNEEKIPSSEVEVASPFEVNISLSEVEVDTTSTTPNKQL